MRVLPLLLVVLAGCSTAVTTTDGGAIDARAGDASATSDGGNPACDLDRACPEAAPVWGGPCEGVLACPFASACGPESEDIYECIGGQWTLTMPAPCAGGSPPLAESCRDPFTGTTDARLWISADGAGAPELRDGDTVEIAFGAQGLAMIPYRVHLDGADAPACVSVTATLTLDTMAGVPAMHSVRLRCGSSLRIQDILPDLPCESREYAIGLDVEVTGAGAVHLELKAIGGMCTLGG